MFRAMTLNLNGYGEKHGEWRVRRERIARCIVQARPDVVALQAVERHHMREGGEDQASQLAALVGGYPYLWYEGINSLPEGGAKGSALLSRHPLQEAEVLSLSHRQDHADGERRALLAASVLLPQGPLRLFNAHFSWVYGQALDNFAECLPCLMACDLPGLFVGDLNTTPERDLIRRFEQFGWSDLWRELRPGEMGATFEADSPELRIDYAFANTSLRPRMREITLVGDSARRLSDHHGLLLTLD